RNIAWIIWHDKLLSRFSTILPDSADTRQVLKVIHVRNPSFLGTQYTKIKSARKICTRTLKSCLRNQLTSSAEFSIKFEQIANFITGNVKIRLI
ncbi:hypothetical protein EFP44_09175, partial [Lacticaseibacillus paracasei]|nr:hypothetical protein [Lacticaseibacillus paracasei]